MGKIPHQKEIEETLEFGRRMNEDSEFRDRIVKILLSPREDKVNEEKKKGRKKK